MSEHSEDLLGDLDVDELGAPAPHTEYCDCQSGQVCYFCENSPDCCQCPPGEPCTMVKQCPRCNGTGYVGRQS